MKKLILSSVRYSRGGTRWGLGGGLSLVQIAAKLELKSRGVNGVRVCFEWEKNGRIKHFGPELLKVYERKN